MTRLFCVKKSRKYINIDIDNKVCITTAILLDLQKPDEIAVRMLETGPFL